MYADSVLQSLSGVSFETFCDEIEGGRASITHARGRDVAFRPCPRRSRHAACDTTVVTRSVNQSELWGGHRAASSRERSTMTESKSERERLREQLQKLPIFPPSPRAAVSRAILPLYVFEPRYREMTAACLAGDKLMAIAQLRPGFEAEYQGRPPVRSIAGSVKIIAHREIPTEPSTSCWKDCAGSYPARELPPDHSYREVRRAAGSRSHHRRV